MFFEDGQFAPGKKIVTIGKGLDAVNGILVSSEKSLAAIAQRKGAVTPDDLVSDAMTEQYWNKMGIVNQESIGYLKPVSAGISRCYHRNSILVPKHLREDFRRHSLRRTVRVIPR